MPRRTQPRFRVEPLEAREQPSVTFPAGANVVDVSRAPYFAVPNDGADDTAAVQKAVNDYMSRDAVLYFPDGTYDFSDAIDYAKAGRGERGLWLQGQSQAGTVFRWGDNLPAFNRRDGAGNPVEQPALDTFNGNNGNAFGNYLHDFTVQIGAGNPGATGVQYQTNNYGSLRNVTIRSADPAGVGLTGLNIIFNEPGPMLLANLTVDGFDTGVFAGPQTYSAVFDGLTVRNQRVAGFQNYRLPVSIRHFTSVNRVPAYVSISGFGWGNAVITDASFTGGGGDTFAVVNENANPNGQFSGGTVFLRNVSAAGYKGVIDDQPVGKQVLGGAVAEYVTQTPLSLVPGSPPASLNLPVEATPATPADPVGNWASVAAFGADPWDDRDDSAAIQRALDSGAKTVYFPNPNKVDPATGQLVGGVYRVGTTLTVGGAVQRVAGLYSRIAVQAPLFGQDAPLFRVVDGTRGLVQIDGFTVGNEGGGGGRWHAVAQDTLATVVVKDSLASGYRNGVRGGKVFYEDVTGSDLRFGGQQAWLRQINPEETVDRPKVVNDGGDLWVLGLKTEGRSTQVDTRNGGRTEVLGGNLYNSHYVPSDYPAFTTTDSSLSVSIAETNYIYQGAFNLWVRDTRNGVVRELTRSNAPIDGARLAANIGLYTDRVVDATAPSAPTNLRQTAATTSSVTLTWDAAADAESRVRAYRVFRDGTFVGSTTGLAYTVSGRPDGLNEVYTVVAENAAGLRGPASAATFAAPTADATRPQLLAAAATPYRGTELVLTFSEPLAAAAPANFAVDNGVTVQAAALSADGRTVTLATSPLTPGVAYTVAATGVTDRARVPNPVVPGTAAAFAYRDAAGGTGLAGSYYPSNNFTGTPVPRLDPVVDFDWGNGSPGVPGIGADNFSVRWTGQVEPRYSETYTFTMWGDDSLRLVVNGRTVIDRGGYSPDEVSGTVTLEAGRRYDIEVSVAEFGGGAGARLWWQSASQPRQIVPAAQLFPTSPTRTVTVRTGTGRGADASFQINDGGVQAEYFANSSTSGTPVLTRGEGGINTDWGTGSPADGVPADNFSVRYTGFVLPQFTEAYTFTAVADDRVRLWVNDQLVLSRGVYSPAPTDAAPVQLTAGVPARFRMEVEEDTGGAAARLYWRSASTVQNYPVYLPPTWQDTGTADTLSTYNRLNLSFFGETLGFRFDLAGAVPAGSRLVAAGLTATLGPNVGDEVSLMTVDAAADAAPNPLWAETGPDRPRFATLPGNRGGNYSFAGGSDGTHLGYWELDNRGYRANAAGRDGLRFQSDALTRAVQADTDGLLTVLVRRTMPNFFGNINLRTKEFGDGSSAPGLQLTLAPDATAAPAGVDLLPGSDTGGSDADDRTGRNNAAPAAALRFAVAGTTPGALVTVYIDGVAVGAAVAVGPTTEVLTRGDRPLADGPQRVTARQTVLGLESADSPALPVTVDTTSPTPGLGAVAPAVRNTPVDAVTVTASEPVTGLTTAAFTLLFNGTPTGLASATLTGSGGSYTLGNLAGLTAAEGTYTLFLTGTGSTAADAAGNPLTGVASVSWAVDLTAPTVALGPVTPVVRNSPVAAVPVLFSEPVTGFDLADLQLTRDGVAVPLTGATLTGAGMSYTLTGLAGLTAAEGGYLLTVVPADSGIGDAAGNPLAAAASVGWATDTAAPTAALGAVTPDPRTTPVEAVPVTFSEPVAGFDLGDVELTLNGAVVDLAGASLTGSGAAYTLAGLTARTAAGGGYQLRVRAAGSGVADPAGNPLAADAVETWTVTDTTVPRVVAVRRLDPNPTRADQVRFAVRFTEPVTGVDAGDFAFRYTGALRDAAVLAVAGGGDEYTVTTTTGVSGGTLRLDLVDDDSVADATGNRLGGPGAGNGTFRRGEAYTVDRVAPQVTGISSVSPGTRRTPVDALTVTFSEPVAPGTVDRLDFALTRDGGPDLLGGGATVALTGPRTVAVGGLAALTAASGRYLFTATAAGVTDLAGNPGANALTRGWVRETPRLVSAVRASASPTNAASVAYVVTFSEPVAGVDPADFRLVTSAGLTGASVTGVSPTAPGVYLVTVGTGAGGGTLRPDFAAAGSGVVDAYGNPVVADFTRGQVTTVDRTPPAVRSVAGVGATTTAAVGTLTVTFTEAVNPATVTRSALTLTRSGGPNLIGDAVTVTRVSDSVYEIGGLEPLTADAGSYLFAVDPVGVLDRAGNAGGGGRTRAWVRV